MRHKFVSGGAGATAKMAYYIGPDGGGAGAAVSGGAVSSVTSTTGSVASEAEASAHALRKRERIIGGVGKEGVLEGVNQNSLRV